MTWRSALPGNRRRGSYPRCLLLADGEKESVAQRLTSLVDAHGVLVSKEDAWMPAGLPKPADGSWDTTPIREADLTARHNVVLPDVVPALCGWWFAVPGGNAPNWDLACTCTVHGRKGVLLVEAKAHDAELATEAVGKRLKKGASSDSHRNHERIGQRIADTSAALSRDTRMEFGIARDRSYQMSNRFAWACKLTELGYAVVLVYLGFLEAEEMAHRGKPLASAEEWEQVVRWHGHGLVPDGIWNRTWTVHGQVFMPLIRSIRVDLPAAA